MTDILLIRHGQTDGNITKIVMGRGDTPLNKAGRLQVRRLSKALGNIKLDAIYTSPSKRTLQTAEILMKGREAILVVEEAGVDEIGFGEWVGKLIGELRESSEGFREYLYHPSRYTPPGGEPIVDAQKRAVGAIEKMLERHAGQRIAVVSHADVMKAILVHYLHMPLDAWQTFKIDNASLTILNFGEGYPPRAMVINHLSEVERYCV